MNTIRWRTAGLALLGLIFVAGCRFETTEEENLEQSIARMFDDSAAAWNAGDLDGFMSIYADASSTTFMTPEGPIRGWEAIRALYAPSFAAGAERDSLRFADLNVRALPPLIGIATGRYILERGDSVSSTGWFTVVVRRLGEGWKIVHDHTSEAGTAADPYIPR